MSTRPLTGVLAALLVIVLIAPASFLSAPQRASAEGVSCLGGIIGGLLGSTGSTGSTISTSVAPSVPVRDSLNQNLNSIGGGASVGSCIKDAILIPLARAAMRAVLQEMTASIISWINGANGTGKPSYVRSFSAELGGVGDAVAFPFISQTATGFNSPFGSSISSALRINYLQNTTLAGFFDANRSTLPGSPQSQRAFLAGDWSQGGIASWFALTTQTQNNPYTLYQTSQRQLENRVSQEQTNRRQDLLQSDGFRSWCGPSDSSSGEEGEDPSDSCFDLNGVQKYIQTSGSIIHDFTRKAVADSGFDQLISATDLDNALGAIIGALAGQVLGGIGGLFGAGDSSGSASPLTSQLRGYSASSVTANQSSFQTAQTMIERIATYTAAWNTIVGTAQTASTSAASLANFCADAAESYNGSSGTFVAAATAQATAAQAVIPSKIVPILAQAQTATSSAAATRDFALQIQAHISGTAPEVSSAELASDVATLITMPPSVVDATNVQQNAQTFGAAAASPSGSLNVSGGSLVDQMNLISTNSATLKTTVCNPNSSLYVISDIYY